MSAIIPCLFGTTKGFELLELDQLPFKAKDLLVAITHGEVELGLDDSCIKILRIKADNKIHTWVGLYRKAYEMGFSREGGYYGAGVWLSDTTVNGRQIIDALEDLCQQIRRLALENRKFQRTLSEIEPRLVASPALNALLKGVPPFSKGGISADAKNCAFITEPQAVHDIINWAQTDALAHNFQSVIIAPASAFPKAGASASITQYADIAAVERALERDYTARLAKADAQLRESQRKAQSLEAKTQSLEAEASLRNSELQSLRQKNGRLESEATRARLPVRPDGRGQPADGDVSLLSEDLAKLLLAGVAVVSVLGIFVMGWLYLGTQAKINDLHGQVAQLQIQLKTAEDQLADKQRQLDIAEGQIAELAEAQLQADKSRGENGRANPESDGLGSESASNSENGGSLPIGDGATNSAPQTVIPATICTYHGCRPLSAKDGPSPAEQAQITNIIEETEGAPPKLTKDIKLTEGERKKERVILRAVQNNSFEVGSTLVDSGVNATKQEVIRVLLSLEYRKFIKRMEVNGVTRWVVTAGGKNYLKSNK